MKMTLGNTLPSYPGFVKGIRRAPDRGYTLTPAQTVTALKNALRYIPSEWHEQLAPEFMEELRTRGRIYGYRFRPEGDLKAKPIDEYCGRCLEGKAFQVMIDNNLCFDIALYPYELVTYGETGQVCQNWMQYRLIKQYLEELTQEQTLVIESGHPLGLFRSRPDAPRVIITNSMMIGQFDNQHDWHIAAQMGVANYGQMTAGGWMYIGPQGIVHGTFNTLLNAGRLKLGIPQDKDLRGHLFVSSGLGGMSGAQPKAAEIAGAASIIAEVDSSRIETRYRQGWVGHVTQDMEEAYRMANEAMQRREPCSIAYHGNVVDLLEYAEQKNISIELLSDQTSCHAVVVAYRLGVGVYHHKVIAYMVAILHIVVHIGKCQLADILRRFLSIHIFVDSTAGGRVAYGFVGVLIVRRMSGSQEERERVLVLAHIEAFSTGNAVTSVDLKMLSGRVQLVLEAP